MLFNSKMWYSISDRLNIGSRRSVSTVSYTYENALAKIIVGEIKLLSAIYAVWSDIISRLPELTLLCYLFTYIRIPSHVTCDNYKLLKLHVFINASESTY